MWRSGSANGYPLMLSHEGSTNPGASANRFECLPLDNYVTLASNPTTNPTTYTSHTLDYTVAGKTALLQGPVDASSYSSLDPIWEQPEVDTFEKKHGYLYNLRLDFMYDPSLYDKDVLHNAQIFLVKIVNFSKSGSTDALRPGTANWSNAASILDSSGDIQGNTLTRGIHFTGGCQDNGTVTLSPRYFNVLHKFNLASNYRSINLGALPGNQTLNWSVSLPLGRMQLAPYSIKSTGRDPTLAAPLDWTNITPDKVDPLKQIHMLVFSNSAVGSTHPFGAVNKRPLLAVRKTFTYGTSLT